jgi:rubrerythrin
MSYRLNADEVFEMAEQMERNAVRFYRRAAELVAGDGTQRILLDLAAMEEEHERIFASLRASLIKPEEREVQVFDPEAQNKDYLLAWADRSVFKLDEDPLAALAGDPSPYAVFTAAISKEKDSIVFYEGITPYLSNKKDTDRVHTIIQEEIGHIALLARLRRDLEPEP